MNIEFIENGSNDKIALIKSDAIEINEYQDALDIMANCGYMDARKIIMYKSNITPDFFDLKTRLAGEILQKFSNYRVRLAIIGDFSEFKSKSLTDFIYESNKHGHVVFVETLDEAINKLGR